MRFDLPTWIRHLRHVGGPLPEAGAPLAAGDLEAAVRAACLGGRSRPDGPDAGAAAGSGAGPGTAAPSDAGDARDAPDAQDAQDIATAPAELAPADGERALWWARADRGVDVDAVLAAADPAARPPDVGPAASNGSLLPRDRYRAIEVWTDADLAAMHALWWLARDRGRADWAARLDEVRAWHLANTQPDNATNRPWAIHVFLLAGSPEDEHYAQTLLHNALAMDAEPTPLGRVLLHDAANALELALARGPSRGPAGT